MHNGKPKTNLSQRKGQPSREKKKNFLCKLLTTSQAFQENSHYYVVKQQKNHAKNLKWSSSWQCQLRVLIKANTTLFGGTQLLFRPQKFSTGEVSKNSQLK